MMQALVIFGVYDDVIEGITHDVDDAIAKLEEVGRLHAKIDAFHADFFQVRGSSLNQTPSLTMDEVDTPSIQNGPGRNKNRARKSTRVCVLSVRINN
jgi:hypothetical protein